MKRQQEGPVLEADDTKDDATKPGDGEAESSATGVEAVPVPPAQEVETLRRERDELRDQVLRRRAEFENYRKRVDRDREQATVDARAQLLSGLLPTVDNFERALSAPPGGDDAALRAGVDLIYRNLMSFLESSGVVVKDPTGERFDPQVHQALMHEAAPGVDEGTITETFRKAYFLKDRLLRPALVKVAKGDDGDGSSENAAH